MNNDRATDKPAIRRTRSFVRRAGRITAGQQRALDELWPRWGIDCPDGQLDLEAIFGRDAPRVLEIGFGNGDTFVRMAAQSPDTDFLGIEVHEPGVGHCLLGIEKEGLTNLRVIRHDAVEVLQNWLPADSFNRIQLFFPDPWPKKRHHKRRIVQPEFMDLVAQVLKPGGVFHVATDWANYAGHIETVLGSDPRFLRVDDELPRLETRFEQRGRRLGHAISDLRYRLRPQG